MDLLILLKLKADHNPRPQSPFLFFRYLSDPSTMRQEAYVFLRRLEALALGVQDLYDVSLTLPDIRELLFASHRLTKQLLRLIDYVELPLELSSSEPDPSSSTGCKPICPVPDLGELLGT